MPLATDDSVKSFPQRTITSAIEGWWDQKIKSQREDPFAVPGSLYDLVADIDSLATVDVLLVLESILGFELPLNVIQRGGYKDLPEMIEHLVPAVRKLYDKHNP